MKHCYLIATFLLLMCCANAQMFLDKAVTDAFVITRMAEKFHVQPRSFDDAFSSNMYDALLTKLDPNRTIFIQQDIQQLQAFRYQLDEEVKNKRGAFIKQLTTLYKQRLQQKDTMLDRIYKTPFNFTLKETLTVAEDTSWPINQAALRTKVYKKSKAFALDLIATALLENTNTSNQKKITDSLEVVVRKRIQPLAKRYIRKLLDAPDGINKLIAESYCEAVANGYDPHSSYFLPGAKDEFESELGKKPLLLGFSLDEDDDNHVVINNLAPGSPAYKTGQMNAGDKITAIQWEGKEVMNVADKDIAVVSDLLNGSGKVTITIKKADGTTRQVTLQKQIIDNGEEDDKVKSFILKGSKSIGYISLPAFYQDWEEKDHGIYGCANDVAKEILKLKKENIDGLIIDLRYNGGGSMQEAIDLAGIFIDAGPVGLEKNKDEKVHTLKDVNRGTIYDGPLTIMVNGYSASASEMLAGTLQDYNRALVVGAPTYGKATAQVILPMDTTINLEENIQNRKAASYIKLTISRLYRVTGQTAQASGVQPDIVLPDILSAKANRESDNAMALRVLPIEANKYFKPFTPLKLSAAKAAASAAVNQSPAFTQINQRIAAIKANAIKKDASLLLADVLAAKKLVTSTNSEDEEEDEEEIADSSKAPFVIVNHAFETKRLQSDSNQKEMNEALMAYRLKDPYIKTVYLIMAAMLQ